MLKLVRPFIKYVYETQSIFKVSNLVTISTISTKKMWLKSFTASMVTSGVLSTLLNPPSCTPPSGYMVSTNSIKASRIHLSLPKSWAYLKLSPLWFVISCFKEKVFNHILYLALPSWMLICSCKVTEKKNEPTRLKYILALH